MKFLLVFVGTFFPDLLFLERITTIDSRYFEMGAQHCHVDGNWELVSKVLGKRSNHANNGGVVPNWSPEEGGAVVCMSEEVCAASGLFVRESTEAMDDLASAN